MIIRDEQESQLVTGTKLATGIKFSPTFLAFLDIDKLSEG